MPSSSHATSGQQTTTRHHDPASHTHSRSASPAPAANGHWEKECHNLIQKYPNDFNNVEIDESVREDGDLSLMVYRNIGSKGVKEILSWDSCRQDQFTKDEAFHDIFKILKMQLPGGKHDLTVQDPVAELRYYAATEKYGLQWLYNSKSSSKKHEVILTKLDADLHPTGETITGSGESSTKACYQARAKLQHKVNKKFKFHRERYLEEIQAQNPKMSEGESFDM